MLTRAIILALMFCGTAQAGETVAFFGITFLDSSLQTAELGQDPDEIARIAMLEEMVRDRFTEEGYELLDLAPVAEDLDRIVNPAKCYGCDTRMATRLGADYALVGEVQKTSNLILSMNLQMRDAASGDMVKGRVVDIRSNTDESWQRGMRYILKTTFFREEEE
ncbi:MAG: DUF2380 domain-containing protein [Rhodobacteraceae bacterium]|jgi:hypothetical protein|uniref:Putative DUF2380 protein n=1 Tax=Salipiger profundus TaxID=1229727 RepID=A0A1U7D379_9RHOB|nr:MULTISPECIES: DUF3280 domain-containing protein [Salipiger]APX22558.1 putative DUF2380 protein [Salipiger profundus]MAB06030.1 DUF2380 domain-containing protein [Paracoccaceae bacterium]GGA11298.1 hypothetical protein GCM10011326_24010 [Salipiger profundus]SFC68985.1 Protein of unknown function [Salipiger profundus]|tara:strand:- start:204 stop:695 length:492 start_codon:yes stop_codon:yes gene_type:complete